MARLVLEDPSGEVEVIVWPNDYEKYSSYLFEDNKIFIRGRASTQDERDAQVISDEILLFDEIPRKLYLRFATMDDFKSHETELYDTIRLSDGKDRIIIYDASTKKIKMLPDNMRVLADDSLLEALREKFGMENVEVV